MPSPSVDTTAAATIAALARRDEIRALPLLLVELVMAMRVAALFERAGRDPVPDLARRYRSVEAATAVDGLVRTVVRCWPERFVVNRPCCTALTPDEATLAALGRLGRHGDRDGFAAQLAGFVRADRHEALYQATIHAIALLPSLH
jgi:hypothetical protein